MDEVGWASDSKYKYYLYRLPLVFATQPSSGVMLERNSNCLLLIVSHPCPKSSLVKAFFQSGMLPIDFLNPDGSIKGAYEAKVEVNSSVITAWNSETEQTLERVKQYIVSYLLKAV